MRYRRVVGKSKDVLELQGSSYSNSINDSKRDSGATLLSNHHRSQCIPLTLLHILPATAVLVGLPLLIWDAHPENFGLLHPWPLIRHIDLVWSSLLRFSIWPIIFLTMLAVAVLPCEGISKRFVLPTNSRASSGKSVSNSKLRSLMVDISQSNWKPSIVLSIVIGIAIAINFGLQLALPSALWNPFIWGRYQVYLPENAIKSLHGACFNGSDYNKQPLCLSESDWKELSSGKLSSLNQDDVQTVKRGLDYLRNKSGGLIVNTLARNVADSIPALKQNMDSLALFLNNSKARLSLVVFENDSDDGTRDLLKEWEKNESSYTVDIIGCGPTNPDCKLGETDRYDKMNMFKNSNASGVGKLGEFRQIGLEYILGKEEYNDFSHMMVLDVDLGVSISPLGLLHTLGSDVAKDYVVASSSVQIWAGGMGTIIPPYDFAAFRPKATDKNKRVLELHKRFCHLMPPGDRWRNMCHAASPIQLFMIQQAADATFNHGMPHEVESAYNGVALYPLSLIRNRGEVAQYDSGDDNQRCEHVGFHLSLRESMYMNPKWSMTLKPSKPGGPTGNSAMATSLYAVFGRPTVMLAILVALVLSILLFTALFVCPLMMIGFSIKSLWTR